LPAPAVGDRECGSVGGGLNIDPNEAEARCRRPQDLCLDGLRTNDENAATNVDKLIKTGQ
ncbi:MAG TPA: hypothetical protein VJW55_19085, partial [Candidatus Angelobacter sp.]|nr:hypothetical protein [Candidatus Angelobacter sp.]